MAKAELISTGEFSAAMGVFRPGVVARVPLGVLLIERTANVVGELRRFELLVDQICGPVPTDRVDGDAIPPTGCLADEILASTEVLRQTEERMRIAYDRLVSRLGL
jgi:hypothetical protein